MALSPHQLPDKQALAHWPRFLLWQVGLGATLGVAFTAALLAVDARGVRTLAFASDAPAAPIVVMALLSAALASCGLLATALAQLHAYPAPRFAPARVRRPAATGRNSDETSHLP